ncbi:MAG: hypothetical protein Tsb0021_12360 [Chlamydiales bacterium]
MKSNKTVIFIPLIFALTIILLNILIVFNSQAALTKGGEEILKKDLTGFVLSNFLFFLPNFLLSFLLWTYIKTENPSYHEALSLCVIAITLGILPSMYLYAFYYDLWIESGLKQPVVMFGFPFVYFVCMMTGWVIGLFFVTLLRKEG